MTYFIGLLTVVLTLNSIFLILLILVQLPKKEAGAGTAFGGAATDALFGAGTGNALTKMTRYSATVFFVLSLILAIIGANRSQASSGKLKGAIRQIAATNTVPAAAASASTSNQLEKVARQAGSNVVQAASNAVTAIVNTNALSLTNLNVVSSNAPAVPVASKITNLVTQTNPVVPKVTNIVAQTNKPASTNK